MIRQMQGIRYIKRRNGIRRQGFTVRSHKGIMEISEGLLRTKRCVHDKAGVSVCYIKRFYGIRRRGIEGYSRDCVLGMPGPGEHGLS